ncbi:TPA: SDR family oxidoreductase [Candidatus Scatousia excrementigallinarum]|uniref:SDR family oxidoreductase n=1 Tax=Candidatus Scatousia excrementigallinarum TaxID=2840935 RepID=A0A9D1JP72_9BACT|nr:SDR family oxidoreductase [Candidatus Scatousia excrementigallinarum]
METILITGVTGLIGKEYVKYFLSKGYRVIGTYRNKAKFCNLFGEHPELIGIEVDLMQENAVDLIIQNLEIFNIFPDFLINNATNSTYLNVNSSGLSPRDNLLNQYIIHVVLPYELSFKLANHPLSKLKKIINIASMYGVVPYNPYLYKNPLVETPVQYSVSKAALIHLTKELAIKFKDKNIQVNSISYGGVDGRVDEEFKEKFAKITPLKRMLNPAETPYAVEFLLSDKSVYMTGHNLVVDGGRTIW